MDQALSELPPISVHGGLVRLCVGGMYSVPTAPLTQGCPVIDVYQKHAQMKEESTRMTGQVSVSASALESKMTINTLWKVGITMTSFSLHTRVKSSVF